MAGYTWAEKKREVVIVGVLAVVVVIALLLASIRSGDTPKSETASTSKYDQTWSKAYNSTTCAELKGSMTQQQRWAMAADMLVGARKADGITAMPSDDLVNAFTGDTLEACTIDSATVTDIGGSLYAIGRAQYGN